MKRTLMSLGLTVAAVSRAAGQETWFPDVGYYDCVIEKARTFDFNSEKVEDLNLSNGEQQIETLRLIVGEYSNLLHAYVEEMPQIQPMEVFAWKIDDGPQTVRFASPRAIAIS